MKSGKKILNNIFILESDLDRLYQKYYLDNFSKIVVVLICLIFFILSAFFLYIFFEKINRNLLGIWILPIGLLLIVKIIKKNIKLYIKSIISFIIISSAIFINLYYLKGDWNKLLYIVLTIFCCIVTIFIILLYKYVIYKKIKGEYEIEILLNLICKYIPHSIKKREFLKNTNRICKINLIEELEKKFLKDIKSYIIIDEEKYKELKSEIKEKYSKIKFEFGNIFSSAIITGMTTIIVSLVNNYSKKTYLEFEKLDQKIRNSVFELLIRDIMIVLFIGVLIYIINCIKKFFLIPKIVKISIIENGIDKIREYSKEKL